MTREDLIKSNLLKKKNMRGEIEEGKLFSVWLPSISHRREAEVISNVLHLIPKTTENETEQQKTTRCSLKTQQLLPRDN